MGTDQKRQFPRLPVHLAVVYRSAAELAAATIETLSAGGVFIRTRAPLPIGTPLTLEISLEDQSLGTITLKGRVAWTRLDAEREGMGVAFVEPPPEALRKILTPRGA